MTQELIKILIVDDSRLELDILSYSMKEAGFDVVAVSDTENILELATEMQPSFILLDLFMPKTSGIDVCRILKMHKETSNIPIMFITASTDIDDVISGMHLGVIDYFHKPVNVPDLILTIKKHDILKRIGDIWQPAREEFIKIIDKYS